MMSMSIPYNEVAAYNACTAEGASGVNLAHSLIMIYILCLIDIIIVLMYSLLMKLVI